MRKLLLLLVLGLCQAVVDGVKVHSCENDFLDISCPVGQLIHINSANYGRTSRDVCSRGPSASTSCYAKRSLDIVKAACQGSRQCVLFASNYMFGDPCSYIVKYLEVDYTCKASQTRGNQRRALICERNFLNLTCPAGQVIHIHDASYGQKNNLVCGRHPNSTSCHSDRSLYVVRKSCEGYNHCYFHVSNSFFCDPCERVWKYLNVIWDCIEGVKDYGRSLACEGHDLNIRCPKDKKIIIISASYGNQDKIRCEHSRIRSDICHGPNSLEIIKARCEEANSCIFTVGNEMFSDPCVGTWKYLTVDYKCSSTQRYSVDHSEDRVMLCYYNENLGYIPQIMPPDMCTHLVYMLALRDISDGQLLARKTSPKGILPRLTRLKRINPSLVTLLGLEPQALTKDFKLNSDNLFKTLDAYGFDGVEVLWWPHVFPIVEDKLKDLKSRLFNTNRMLTVSIVSGRHELPKILQLENFVSYSDLFTLAPFDSVNSYNDLNLAINYIIKRRNVPKKKLLLGLPFFGWKVVNYEDDDGVEKTRTERINYRDLCTWLQDPSSAWEEHWDTRTSCPYAVNINTGETLNFQNAQSLKKKTDIIIDAGIRGATILDLQVDDHQGVCGKEFPLSQTVKSYLNINVFPFYFETFVQNQEFFDN